MIPKIIHYIWFGTNKKPSLVNHTIDSWKRVMPDYEIRECNENNFDVLQHPWMERMHRTGKFAFASDWARLHLLRQHGGVYLDTDVEVKKPFDPFLDSAMFWGFEYDCYLATCITGSKPKHPLLDLLLAEYDDMEDNPINNAIVTRFFLKQFPEFRLTNVDQLVGEDIRIYGKEYFSVPTSNHSKGFCRHHGSNLWREHLSEARWSKRAARAILGEVLYYKLVAKKVCMTNEFYPIYKAHRNLK